jgi:hypothetical protein
MSLHQEESQVSNARLGAPFFPSVYFPEVLSISAEAR